MPDSSQVSAHGTPGWVSVAAVAWVLDHAPDVPPSLVSTLIGLARHSRADGTCSYPAVETLMRYTRKKERQVKQDLRALKDLGLIIVSPDQTATMKFRSDRRPVVYDLPLWLCRIGADGDVQDSRGAPDCTPHGERGAVQRQTGCSTESSGVHQTAPKEEVKKTEEPSSSARTSHRSRIATIAGTEDDEEIDLLIKEITNAATKPIHNLGAYLSKISDDDIRLHHEAVKAGSAARADAARKAANAREPQCPLHRGNRWNACRDCWAHVKTGEDPFAGLDDLRPDGWHDAYQWTPPKRTTIVDEQTIEAATPDPRLATAIEGTWAA